MPPVGKPGGWGVRGSRGDLSEPQLSSWRSKAHRKHRHVTGKHRVRCWELETRRRVCVSQAPPPAAERNAPPQPLAPVLHVCTLRPSDKDASPVKPGPLSPRLHWVQSAKTRFPNEVTLGGAVRLPHAFSCGAHSHGTEGAHDGW